MSLPALPLFVRTLHASAASAQLTLSLYLIGFAAGQLILGPASDRFGRRPVMLAGLFFYTLASCACAFAGTIEQLVTLRCLQGMGASVGAVIVRAIIRDYHGRTAGTQALAGILTWQAAAPLVAPIFGSYLVVAFGWRSIFVALGATAVLMWFAAYAAVHESLGTLDPQATNPGRFTANARRFLTNPQCLAYSLITGAGSAALFAYLSGSPFVLIQVFGIPTQVYGFAMAGNALLFMSSNQVNIALLRRMSPEPVLRIGLTIAAAAVIGLTVGMRVPGAGVAAFLICTYAYFFSYAIIFPNAIAAALEPIPQITGVGASLVGVIQMVGASIGTYSVGRFYDRTPSSVTLSMAAAVASACLVYLVLRLRPAPPPREQPMPR